jgi:protein phosphatase
MFFSFFNKRSTDRNLPPDALHQVDYRAFAATDIGNVRKTNEDEVLFVRPHDRKLRQQKGVMGIVADGMGGHNCGEVAARMAVETISEEFFAFKGDDVLKGLAKAVDKANGNIFGLAQSDPTHKGMGTTCVVAVLRDRELFLAHVGDSRAYRVSTKGISQLTQDHTYVQSLFDRGVISAEEKDSHPKKNYITKALGTRKQVVPDVFRVPALFEPDDRLFLCTDGLYDYLSAEEIHSIVLKEKPSEASQKMIAMAKNRGGHDNMSTLILEQRPVKATLSVTKTIS